MLKNNPQAKKPHELYIMPNTGHHYYFIPFSAQFMNEHGIKAGELTKIWRSENSPWQGVPKKNFDSKTPNNESSESQERYTWMRYRFGHKGGAQNLGLWLAIESNLGTVKRGTLFEERPIAEREMPKNAAEYEVSPYAYPNHAAIGRSTQQGAKKEVKDAYSIILPVELEGGRVVPFEQVDIIWQNNDNVMDVDLIVDFGNTRTVVLALENNRQLGEKGQFNYLCKEISFLPRGQEYIRPNKKPGRQKFEHRGETIADSWFLLQQPMFAEWDYPSPNGSTNSFFTSKQYRKEVQDSQENEGGIMQIFGSNKPEPKVNYYCTQRVPQMFVEISPALMGEEAKRLMNNIDMERGLHVSMSSPKRYLWDRGRSPHSWHINFNSWSNIVDRSSLPSLQGQICRYMYSDGRDWDIEHPPFEHQDLNQRPLIIPQRATFPRSTAMMWSALSIIESAYRQITSYNWRAGDDGSVARRLRSINVTFPSGWIAKERQYYRQAWQQAVNIFTLAHMNTRELVTRESRTDEEELHKQGRPELYVDLDEAVASQLPFIYSEISRLKDADLWIELYGRKAPEASGDTNSRVRVMTIDIGGGTLDTAIVEYYNDAPAGEISLRYKVLFRDSNTFAGDNVTLAIIQKVLLKSFLNARGIPANPNNEVASNFMQALSDPNRKLSDRARWQRIVTLLFLPIVRQWLSDVANYPSGHPGQFRSIEECGGDETAIKEFNDYLTDNGVDANFIKRDDRLEFNPEEINTCIKETLRPGIEPLGQFTAAYDVDVVTVSGKISEMPTVEQLLHRYLPISPQCIVRMKDYLAGSWYPMSKNNRIADAKTVTAVGAALYKAGNGLLGNYWDCQEDDSSIQNNSYRCKNYWGTMRPDDAPRGFNEILLTPSEMDNRNRSFTEKGKSYSGTKMKIRSCIGRQKYHTQTTVPQRLYRLCWTGPESQFNNSWILAVVVERVSNSDAAANGDSYAMDEDDIKLVSVELCNPTAKDQNFDPTKVELQLCTLPDEGFWMEECRFSMDF